jgi:uncharacterized protein (DUF1810 family)
MAEGFDLARFVKAQTPLMERVLGELRAGKKMSHWMWFVFPQLAGLGHSPMSRHYAIGSLEEARAYLAHEVLGPRLMECTALVNAVEGRSLHAIFGSPDDRKFQSSMTLFAKASPETPIFRAALTRYCDGAEDRRTVDLLGSV